MMTDDRRKVLAEFEGIECIHVADYSYGTFHFGYGPSMTVCKKCGKSFVISDVPTYTTDADMLRVARKMTETEWAEFQMYLFENEDFSDITRFLFADPERALCLAADWIERGKG